ncbi:ABC transporter substrate-binding protein [Haladaptatus sp. DFWS20]|uniref:ABC transporter substrate-binding protein n=1 Tax=Haladaptatus sp. DFWS20 TaxID=3403467 RepID=UPI003EBF5F86
MAEIDKHDPFSRRTYLKTIGIGGVGVALAGCTDSKSSNEDGSGGKTKNKDTFVVGMSSKASTLDVQKATRRPESTILSAIHETLFRLDKNKKPVPHLAKEFSKNKDATEFTFQLEDGVTFHNGEKFTADVAKWSYERFLENSPNSYLIGPVDSIEAPKKTELTINFKEPFPLLPRNLTNWSTAFTSKKAVNEAGDSYGQSTAVGTGPYEFNKWERGTAVTVSQFDDYNWGPDFAENTGPGKVNKFRFELLPESTTLLQELTSGKVDGSSYVALSDTGKVEDSSNTNLERKRYTRPGFLALNTQKAPMDDVRIRRAINHAVKKEPVIEAALGGEGYPIWSIVPPIAVNSLEESEAKKMGEQYDPKKARSLLEEAGWTNSKEGETRTKDGKKLKLTFYAFTIPRYAKIGKTVAPMLGQVGIDTDLKVLEAGTLYNNLEAGKHHLTTMAYGGNWAVNALEPILKGENAATEGGTNYSLWQNKKFDSLLNKAKADPDKNARKNAIMEAQKLVIKEAPVTPICAFNKIYGYKKSVTGMDAWTQHAWWPDQEWLNRLEMGF